MAQKQDDGMTGSESVEAEVLRQVAEVYRGWRSGEICSEDALFMLADIIDLTPACLGVKPEDALS